MANRKYDSSWIINVWRAATSDGGIVDLFAAVRLAATPALQGGRLVIRVRNDKVLETVGGPPDRMDLDEEQCRGLEKWARLAEPRTFSRAEIPELLLPLTPFGDEATCWISPITRREEFLGAIIVFPVAGRRFDRVVREAMAQLAEPIAVALMHERRRQELNHLKEAAEAEKRALLAKLGRTEIGGPIVGMDSGLRTVMERVNRVAASDVPVLLFGETGTGKEVVARAIHSTSKRANRPFIRVNCGAIPHELVDSQLFGHERGSFTGATESRKGWFERADGGTLFLDEIGELPPAAQVRLLRVLQDGLLERVGGQKPILVDVRVVGATHRDLPAMVRARTFREDLWYRLAVFTILIPPLRERPEDIGPLARNFAEKAAIRFGLAPAMPNEDDLRRLAEYSWPGNVRELAAVIDRAALLANGPRLAVAAALGRGGELAPSDVRSPRLPIAERGVETSFTGDFSVGAGPGRTAPDPSAASLGEASLDKVIRERIESVLRACHGRIDGVFGAASRLRIHPNTLRSRMKRLGIDWRSFRPELK